MKNEELSIDGFYAMTLDLSELEIVPKGMESIKERFLYSRIKPLFQTKS